MDRPDKLSDAFDRLAETAGAEAQRQADALKIAVTVLNEIANAQSNEGVRARASAAMLAIAVRLTA
jgi:hypothetical protein